MIEIKVKNSTGSVTESAKMNEHGIIFFENGDISSVIAEVAKGKHVFRLALEEKKEQVMAQESSEAQSQKQNKRRKK